MFYQDKEISSKKELLTCYSKDEFSSPFRSTIPLIELYFENKEVLKQIIPNYNDSETIFEKKTKIKESRRASFSDLRLKNKSTFYFIEAKRTEPKYETVKKFLQKDERHKVVLNGWLEIINKRCNTNLSIDDVYDITYQMIHRFASACNVPKDKKAELLYFCFDINESKKNYYYSELLKIIILTNAIVPIKLVLFKIEAFSVFEELEERWSIKKQRKLSSAIKEAMNKKVMNIALEKIIEVK